MSYDQNLLKQKPMEVRDQALECSREITRLEGEVAKNAQAKRDLEITTRFYYPVHGKSEAREHDDRILALEAHLTDRIFPDLFAEQRKLAALEMEIINTIAQCVTRGKPVNPDLQDMKFPPLDQEMLESTT